MKRFLEIGSCDFETLSYLADLGWNGIMIEPIPKYFENLVSSSTHPNIYYINAAIDWNDGKRIMYMASKENIEKVIEESICASRLTHNYYLGFLGGMVVALFTAWAMNGIPAWKWPEQLINLYTNKTIHKYFPEKDRDKLIPYQWMPKWCGEMLNPSGRLMNAFNKNL